MFKVDLLKSSRLSIISLHSGPSSFLDPIGSSRVYVFRRPFPHCFTCPLPWRTKEATLLPRQRSERVLSSHRPMRRHTKRHIMLARAICLRPMTIAGSDIGGFPSQPQQSTGMHHRVQFLSGILKSIFVALVIALRYSCNIIRKKSLIIRLMRAARKRPRIFKFVRIIKKRRQNLRKIHSSLASAGLAVFVVAFPFFVVWDMGNLSHDEPIGMNVKKIVREDPVGALSEAREELARMTEEERNHSQGRKRGRHDPTRKKIQ